MSLIPITKENTPLHLNGSPKASHFLVNSLWDSRRTWASFSKYWNVANPNKAIYHSKILFLRNTNTSLLVLSVTSVMCYSQTKRNSFVNIRVYLTDISAMTVLIWWWIVEREYSSLYMNICSVIYTQTHIHTHIWWCNLLFIHCRETTHFCYIKVDSRLTTGQWDTLLQGITVSHGLGAKLESALYIICDKFNIINNSL